MRRFETDYAGAWRGFCKTRENAIIAAIKHIVNDGYSRCTITDRETGDTVTRVRLNAARNKAEVSVDSPFKEDSRS
jgi:hypothetical protein